MPSYALTLSLDLADGETPKPADLYGMLEDALQSASENPEALLEKLTQVPPSEANWVIRSEKHPNLIFSHGKGWFVCKSEDVLARDLHAPDAGKAVQLEPRSIWCRRDLISGQAVLADLHSDDRIIDLQVDIRPFLEIATADEIENLISEEWSYAESADQIAYALEAAGDPGAGKLFWYLGMNPHGNGNDQIGFGLSADGAGALAWLETYRPEIFSVVSPQGDSPEL